MSAAPGIRRFYPQAQLYCLVLRHHTAERLDVGALGTVHWPAGWTYYVGRARRGWVTRLKRFTKPFSNHWHVDYLVSSSRASCRYLAPVLWLADRECDLVERLKHWGGGEQHLAEGFGSSDCERGCGAHGWLGTRAPEECFPDLAGSCPLKGWIEFLDDRCRWHTLRARTTVIG